MTQGAEHNELHHHSIHVEQSINETDQELILSFLGRLGYRGTIIQNTVSNDQRDHLHPNYHEAESSHRYRFSDITKGSDILLREHFDNLAAVEGVSSPSHTRAFHKLINANNHAQKPLLKFEVSGGRHWYTQIREPEPFSGIKLVKRAEVGIEPYDSKYKSMSPEQKVLAKYGIIAESANNALIPYRSIEISSTTRKTDRALQHIAQLLFKQIIS